MKPSSVLKVFHEWINQFYNCSIKPLSNGMCTVGLDYSYRYLYYILKRSSEFSFVEFNSAVRHTGIRLETLPTF